MRKMDRIRSLLLIFILAPTALAQSPSLCFPRGSFSPTPRWDREEAKYMARYLQLLGEPCLFPLHSDPKPEVYRFLWMRTFNPPVSVRLDIQADGTGKVTVTTMQGESGFGSTLKGPTTVTSRLVGADEVVRFRELFRKTGFLTIPSIVRGDQQGTDGSDWRIEAVIAGQYHTASRWSPTSSKGPGKQAIAELGKALAFEIGKFQADSDEIY
jgi:hypothetical protein